MNKKKLIIGGLALVNALIVSSIALSVAWYQSGAILTISNINVSFAGEKEIFIGLSKDGEFVSKLDEELDQIENYYPVSSMFSTPWLTSKSDTPELRSTYQGVTHYDSSTYQESKLAKSGYYQQRLYLYSETPVYVTLDKEKTIASPNEERNALKVDSLKKEYSDLSKEEILANLNNVHKSLRFSILNPKEDEYDYDIIDPYKDGETYLCGVLDHNEDEYYDYYSDDVGNQYEYVYGEYNDESKVVYNSPGSESEREGYPTVFNAKHHEGVHTFNMEESINNGFIPKEEDAISLDEMEDNIIIPVYPKQPKEIVVSVYLEGWDLDNTNLTCYGEFNMNVSFKIWREMFI